MSSCRNSTESWICLSVWDISHGNICSEVLDPAHAGTCIDICKIKAIVLKNTKPCSKIPQIRAHSAQTLARWWVCCRYLAAMKMGKNEGMGYGGREGGQSNCESDDWPTLAISSKGVIQQAAAPQLWRLDSIAAVHNLVDCCLLVYRTMFPDW